MVDLVYVEQSVADHPRVKRILERLSSATVVSCTHWGEVFNRNAQSFRLQKKRPALILAKKTGRFVHETPSGYGIGGVRNYYFSHMLNCVYDCRYCFLQGMFRSANYVVFVNFEDFAEEIATVAARADDDAYFFSGYDCDSLAFEPVTGFASEFLSTFESLPKAWIELRTKTSQMSALTSREALDRCVVAFSMTPSIVSKALENKVPPLERRLAALGQVSERGWPIGLRFDPLIHFDNCREAYSEFFASVFEHVDVEQLHSVSVGPFRLPKPFFKRAAKEYPDEPLFAGSLAEHGEMVSYEPSIEDDLVGYCSDEILRYIPESKFFPCQL